MRKFSISMILLVIVLFPTASQANQVENTKTKIGLNNLLEIKDNFIYSNKLPVACKFDLATESKESLSERDLVLLKRWRERQSYLWKNLSPKKFTINASAYTAAADECGKSDGITASGLKVQEKRTLACPPIYPFGTKIKIEGYGIYTCEDRGGAIKGNKFDIYMKTKSEAFAFGRRHLTAEIVL